MYLGRYYHTLETNGRVSLPKDFRANGNHFVATRGLDGGLLIFPEDAFTSTLQQLRQTSFTKKDQRDLIRLMTNEAKVLELDKLGRVQLPDYLVQFAQLKKEVVWVGSYAYLELWDQTIYHQYLDQIEPEYAAIAERFDVKLD